MLRIERLGVEQIERLIPEWSALWRRQPTASPFLSPAWLMPWWRSFGNGVADILTARDGGALVGLLPLYRYDEAGRRKILPIGIGVSDYFDALIDPSAPTAAQEMFAAIEDIPDWDECYLPELAPDAALLACARPDSRIATVSCPVLELPGSLDAPGGAIPRKMLRDLRQAATRAAAVGPVVFERADAETLDAAMQDFFRLHQRRWQSRGESGVCADPAVRAFQLESARAMLQAGLLRLYTLRVGGAALAVYFGFLRGERAYAYLGGFDPDRPRLSPGAQIVGYAIAEAIAEGAREFHFLRGGEAYKYAWGAVDRWNTAVTLRRE